MKFTAVVVLLLSTWAIYAAAAPAAPVAEGEAAVGNAEVADTSDNKEEAVGTDTTEEADTNSSETDETADSSDADDQTDSSDADDQTDSSETDEPTDSSDADDHTDSSEAGDHTDNSDTSTGLPDFPIVKLSRRTWSGYCDLHKCQKPKGNPHPTWTIHGLWPSTTDGGKGPENCANGDLDLSVIEDLRDNLTLHWPSFTSDSHEELWKEEFRVHGSCMVDRVEEDIPNPKTYFELALVLNEEYNVTQWLDSEDIKPNNKKPVSVKDIETAISKVWLADDFELYCEERKDKTLVLQEIRLCFTSSDRPTPVKCGKTSNSCGDKQVWYLGNSGTIGMPSAIIVLATALLVLFTSKN